MIRLTRTIERLAFRLKMAWLYHDMPRAWHRQRRNLKTLERQHRPRKGQFSGFQLGVAELMRRAKG